MNYEAVGRCEKKKKFNFVRERCPGLAVILRKSGKASGSFKQCRRLLSLWAAKRFGRLAQTEGGWNVNASSCFQPAWLVTNTVAFADSLQGGDPLQRAFQLSLLRRRRKRTSRSGCPKKLLCSQVKASSDLCRIRCILWTCFSARVFHRLWETNEDPGHRWKRRLKGCRIFLEKSHQYLRVI